MANWEFLLYYVNNEHKLISQVNTPSDARFFLSYRIEVSRTLHIQVISQRCVASLYQVYSVALKHFCLAFIF